MASTGRSGPPLPPLAGAAAGGAAAQAGARAGGAAAQAGAAASLPSGVFRQQQQQARTRAPSTNKRARDDEVKIQKDSEVQLKIIGTRVDATEIFCIGTIKDDFLGVISDPGAAV